jgi:hypothetical protein
MRKNSLRVSFDDLGDKIIPNAIHHVERTKDQLKASWYSREQLMESCIEAKKIVRIINSVDGDFEAIDHSRICIVGLEKFHGKKEREINRKLLIKSVLIRQEMNRGLGLAQDVNCLCEISEMISTSFKEFALWQAAMHKFHARESQSTTRNAGERSRDEPDNLRAKRQKLMAGTCSSPVSTDASSSAVEQDPEIVREEVHQLMAGSCSP